MALLSDFITPRHSGKLADSAFARPINIPFAFGMVENRCSVSHGIVVLADRTKDARKLEARTPCRQKTSCSEGIGQTSGALVAPLRKSSA